MSGRHTHARIVTYRESYMRAWRRQSSLRSTSRLFTHKIKKECTKQPRRNNGVSRLLVICPC